MTGVLFACFRGTLNSLSYYSGGMPESPACRLRALLVAAGCTMDTVLRWTSSREVSPVLLCPLCRAPCDALEASSLANAVRLASPLLLEAAAQLPLRTDEIAATVNALLVARHFHVDDVKNAVEAMSLCADAAVHAQRRRLEL